MKKRFFAGLLLAFMLIMTAVPTFAVPAEEAPVADEDVVVPEEPAEVPEDVIPEDAIPYEVPTTPAIPEIPPCENGTSFAISNPEYNAEAQLFSISIENTSENTEFLGYLVVEYKPDTFEIPMMERITDASVVKPFGVSVENGVAIKIFQELEPKAKTTIKFDAVVPEGAKGTPEVAIGVLSETIPNEMNFSTNIFATEPTSIKYQKFENVLSVSDEDGSKTPGEAVSDFVEQTGFAKLITGFKGNWGLLVMILISLVLMYLAIVKKFEPLLLLPIAFGMLLTNLPGIGVFHEDLFADGHVHWDVFFGDGGTITPGLIDYLYLGVKLGIYPCLIFFGVGAMTDFGPLIANPKSLLLGAAAQLGIFITYLVCFEFFNFSAEEAASTGIIGGADGPTAIFVTSKLAPKLLGPIAVAAYSYMALVPVIQPPIMKALTTKKERQIIMKPLREVSKTEKIVFPIVVTIFVSLLVPSAGPLVGSLMLGNLAKESGVTERLSKTMQNELMNIVTIFLGISVGATATAETFLAPKTLAIICMGVVAFGFGTAGGVLLAKFMNLFLKNKINPLIGSAGVSAVPMAARVSQTVGQKENPQNFLLMHAMGPNVAGVIGSAIAAGVLIALFG